MARYTSIPTTVEATQWFPGQHVNGVEFDELRDEVRGYYVVTIHGQRSYLDPGDWVITEPDHIHHYPCKPDVFAARYRPA